MDLDPTSPAAHAAAAQARELVFAGMVSDAAGAEAATRLVAEVVDDAEALAYLLLCQASLTRAVLAMVYEGLDRNPEATPIKNLTAVTNTMVALGATYLSADPEGA